MKEKQDYLKFLLPLVAVVVIVESVVLLSRLEEKRVVEREPVAEMRKQEETAVKEEPVVALSFAAQETRMKVGEEYVVEVNAAGLADSSLDAIDLYIMFDPQKVRIADNLDFGDKLEKPVFAKVSEKKQVVVANFLIMKEGGLKLAEGEVIDLLKFRLMPLEAGETKMELATGNEDKDSVTMFVESQTGKQLAWSASRLEVMIEE